MITLWRQSFLCCDNLFVHSSNMYVATLIPMSQHSFSVASASWCCDQSFHVAIVTLSCFFKLVRDLAFLVATSFLFLFLLQHVLYYYHLGHDQKKYFVTKLCLHLVSFLVTALFLMLRLRLLCWGCFTCCDPIMLHRYNTFLHASYFLVAT